MAFMFLMRIYEARSCVAACSELWISACTAWYGSVDMVQVVAVHTAISQFLAENHHVLPPFSSSRLVVVVVAPDFLAAGCGVANIDFLEKQRPARASPGQIYQKT